MNDEIQLADVSLSDLYKLIGSQQVHITRLRTALQQALRDNSKRIDVVTNEAPTSEE